MAIIYPNPPTPLSDGDLIAAGRTVFCSASVGMSNGTGALNSSTTWTPAFGGNAYAPVQSSLNPVTRIPRVGRQGPVGAGQNPGVNFGTPNASSGLWFPDLNDMGGEFTALWGFDSQVAPIAAQDLFIGLANAPMTLPLAAAGNSFFGLFKESGSSVVAVGRKVNGGAIATVVALPTFLWQTFVGYYLKIRMDPLTQQTSWLLQSLTATGTYTLMSQGTTPDWQPGRIQLAPCYNVFKNSVPDVHEVWFSLLTLKIYVSGRASLGA